MQQVQVVPVQSTAGAGQPIMLQSQVIQTADGQTLIYQPVQMQDGTQALVQQPAQAISQGGQVIQLAATVAQPQPQMTQMTTSTSTTSSIGGQQASVGTSSNGNQNIIMMVPGAAGGSPTIQRIPLPGNFLKMTNKNETQKF